MTRWPISPVGPVRHLAQSGVIQLAHQSGPSGEALYFLMLVPISPVGHILGRGIGIIRTTGAYQSGLSSEACFRLWHTSWQVQ